MVWQSLSSSDTQTSSKWIELRIPCDEHVWKVDCLFSKLYKLWKFTECQCTSLLIFIRKSWLAVLRNTYSTKPRTSWKGHSLRQVDAFQRVVSKGPTSFLRYYVLLGIIPKLWTCHIHFVNPLYNQLDVQTTPRVEHHSKSRETNSKYVTPWPKMFQPKKDETTKETSHFQQTFIKQTTTWKKQTKLFRASLSRRSPPRPKGVDGMDLGGVNSVVAATHWLSAFQKQLVSKILGRFSPPKCGGMDPIWFWLVNFF